jgi:hypothetical protein
MLHQRLGNVGVSMWQSLILNLKHECSCDLAKCLEFMANGLFRNIFHFLPWNLKPRQEDFWVQSSSFINKRNESYIKLQASHLLLESQNENAIINCFDFLLRFEVLTAVSITNTTFWDVTSCVPEEYTAPIFRVEEYAKQPSRRWQ